jgi:light-regulated signal transduction histidine kinase (bacteriophytochrome)
LRGIHHFVHFLQDSLGDRLEPREQHWLDGLSRLSQRMSAQIEALLQYSRATQQSLQPAPTDLNALVSEVRENLTARLENNRVRMIVRGSLPMLNCDPVRVRVVLENLIANGIKYNDKAERRIEIGASASVPPILYVKDNGIGIAREYQESVFNLFRRLHGRDEYGGGTGAGLTLARKHVERHGGRLWLESTPGAGTCFYFTLAPGNFWPSAQGHNSLVQEPS